MANALQDLSRGATLSNYTPSLRENITNKLAQLWYGDNREGTQKANRLMDLLDFTPVGMATGMYDAGRDLGQGNYGMGLAGIGLAAMPVPGGVKKEAQQGIRAFHGSPHDFNAFDMSKIGTGEGAQAYGHGLYFAEKEGTAKTYRDNLAGYKFVQDALDKGQDKRPAQVAEWLYADPNMSDEHIAGALGVLDGNAPHEQIQSWTQQGRKLLAESKDAGKMYEVSINAHPDQFLDWDKPLGQQSQAIQDLVAAGPPRLGANDVVRGQLAAPDGQAIYRRLGSGEELKKAGIPGIKYLDQGSRAAGDGSRNYVVFDDKLISIVKKYGIAGGLMLGAITQQQANDLKAQGY